MRTVGTLDRYAGERRWAAAALRALERGLPWDRRSTIVAHYRCTGARRRVDAR